MQIRKIAEFTNRILCGDCTKVMQEIPSESIDLVVADPPYLANYRSTDGRSYQNDNPNKAEWLKPAFAQIHRVLKQDSYCVCFFGWHVVDKFMSAWRSAGFNILEHLVWVKNYPSSVGFVQRFHDSAYLLGKRNPPEPQILLRSVLEWEYTGNELHPTQRPVMSVLPLIMAYSRKGDIVLDPFVGSGTTAVASAQAGRRYIGIEIDSKYCQVAQQRLQKLCSGSEISIRQEKGIREFRK